MDPGFDDSGWRQLDVPHDWSIELAPVDNASTSSGTGFLQGGLAWYRKHFTLPTSMAGQRISVEFDGVYSNSNVYLNGQLLGNHPYAYTGFSYDLTGLVHTDGVTPNVIAVRRRTSCRAAAGTPAAASSATSTWSPPGRSTSRGTARS